MKSLLLVHAHPDDEAISTGGVMMRAKAAGHRVVLVTATRGEEGEIHNLDEAETRPRLAEVRTEELRAAGEILGVDRQEFLGYRDSGMAGTPSNENRESFHRAPLLEAAGRLSKLIREERPDVVITYTSDGTYGHPDHIKAHHVTVAALDLLADTEGWQPSKFYLHAIPVSLMREWERRARENDPEVPPRGENRIVGIPDEEITTSIDVRPFAQTKMRAFAAHTSQNDPKSPFANMQDQILEAAFGTEHFILARGALGDVRPEQDLFEGLGP